MYAGLDIEGRILFAFFLTCRKRVQGRGTVAGYLPWEILSGPNVKLVGRVSTVAKVAKVTKARFVGLLTPKGLRL
jgi:hypothetical protein